MAKSTDKREAARVSIKGARIGHEVKSALSFLKTPDQGTLPLVNLSMKGCQFLSFDRVDMDTILHINIHVPAFLDPLISYGRVVWCRRVPKQRKAVYRVGVQFEKIKGKGSKRLESLARDVMLRHV